MVAKIIPALPSRNLCLNVQAYSKLVTTMLSSLQHSGISTNLEMTDTAYWCTHPPTDLRPPAAWAWLQAAAFTLGQCFSNHLDYKNHPKHLLQMQIFGLPEDLLNQILKEKNNGTYIINKCQSHHAHLGDIFGKPCSGISIELGKVGQCWVTVAVASIVGNWPTWAQDHSVSLIYVGQHTHTVWLACEYLPFEGRLMSKWCLPCCHH